MKTTDMTVAFLYPPREYNTKTYLIFYMEYAESVCVCKMISATMRDHTHASFLYLHTFLHIIVLSFQRRKEVHHFATVKSRFKNVFVILPAQKKKKIVPVT